MIEEFEQKTLPNATAILIFGVLSIVTCCCYGIFGIILAAVALILYKKDHQLYLENPSLYSNYSNLNTGKILAIIGLVLSVISLAYFIFIFNNVIGWDAIGDQELMLERMREFQENQ